MSKQIRKNANISNTDNADRGAVPVHKHKRKRRGGGINVLMVVLFAVIFVYMIKYAIDFTTGSTSVGIETVNYGTIDLPNSFNGLAVRDEHVVLSDITGVPTFNYGEGDRVKKDSVIVSVSESETADSAKDKLKSIDESIIETQKNRLDISKYKDEIDHAENSIDEAVSSAARNIAGGNMNSVYTMRSAVQTQLDIRTEIWVKENSEGSDSSLSQERKSYQSKLDSSTHSFKASESGILVLSCDGLEDKFTLDTLDNITQKNIKDGAVVEYLSKTTAIKSGEPVFKIVSSNTWYICAYIDSSISSQWQVGDTKVIRAFVDKSEKNVNVTIKSITEKDGSMFVVFTCNRNVQDFLNVRTFEFYISDSSYVGLKVPNTAIIEKTFIKIPIDCIVESLDGKSVVKRTGGSDKLVTLEVESTDAEFAYVRQDFDSLKIGDVILKGTGESATEYTLSEVSTKTGVLTVNGAFAKFASIAVLGKNSEYTIADSEKSGLKAYDKIIINASDANEGDEIY